jgi:hypothetical protein
VNTTPIPDLEQARRFLRVLTLGDPAVTFQTFSDREELKEKLPNGKLYDPNASWRHGTLDALTLYLTCRNAKRAGVFVMVNKGDGKGRSAENVQLVRALFMDTDGAPFPTCLPLKPHIIVESSPGKWHVYVLVTGVDLAHFAIFQQALAERYGTDPSVKDLPRVMRLPGFYHLKVEPVMVQLLEANDHRPYTVAEVYAAWPLLPDRLQQAKALEAERERRRAEIVRRAAERRALPATDTSDQARAERLLQAHHDTVAAGGDGTRHDTLLRAARALGGYVGGGYLDAEEVEAVLLAAAEACGLPDAEAADVIRWGLDRGADDPLELAPPTSFDARQASGAKAIASNISCAGQAKPLLMQPCNNAMGAPRLDSGGRSGVASRPALGGKPCL